MGAHDKPAHSRRDGFDVFLVRTHNADMGEGEGDDLPRIGRIGQDLLIAGHRGVEADLAHRIGGRPEGMAFESRAVGQHQNARGPRGKLRRSRGWSGCADAVGHWPYLWGFAGAP